jgi:hypothetical protein
LARPPPADLIGLFAGGERRRSEVADEVFAAVRNLLDRGLGHGHALATRVFRNVNALLSQNGGVPERVLVSHVTLSGFLKKNKKKTLYLFSAHLRMLSLSLELLKPTTIGLTSSSAAFGISIL